MMLTRMNKKNIMYCILLLNQGEITVNRDHIKTVKFGGSSLSDANQFKKVAAIIKSDKSRRYVVPSAPGKRYKDDIKVTDMLYKCNSFAEKGESIDVYFDGIKKRYNEIIKELGLTDFSLEEDFEEIKRNINNKIGSDYAASRGEYLNAKIMSRYLGYDFIDAAEVIFFKEDGRLDEEKTNTVLKKYLSEHRCAVIPGFYGSTPDGQIKTFSRGGSDITGSIVARACDAELYENWTDVSGFLSADPRIVNDPKPIEIITYKELRELSYMGATVLHEDAIFPVRTVGIPVQIKNTNEPESPGTLIVPKTDIVDTERVITGIAGKKNFSVITLEQDMMNSAVGFGRRVLEVFEKHGMVFEHLPSGIDTMSVVISTAQIEGHRDELINELCHAVHPDCIYIDDNMALLAVVGRGMIGETGTAARVFGAIAKAGVNLRMIDQGSSEINIIVGVDENDLEKAMNAIYDEFVR